MVRSSPTLFFGTAHHAGDNVRQLPLLWRFPSHDDGDHRPNANNHPGGMTRWRPRFPKSYSVATPPSSSGGGGGGRGGYGDGSGDGNGSVAGGQGGGLGVKHHSRQFLKQFDEKARFSNERTYLHWIKFGMLLGSMALTLLSFGDRKSVGFPVGMFLVLVAMATLAYATTMFHCRDYWMRHRRTDRLYYDRVGPSILFAALFLAYATNVILTVYRITEMQDDNQHTFLGNPNGPLDV
ncbi:vacuolar transporter chaperone [Actinomortierella ambigua]|nr:vacuolar transporter chaperone [Actinomortierella ambigua]